LAWEKFEKLILALAKRESGVEHAQRFGNPGQIQSGIEIYGRLREEGYVVYQCRRVKSLTAGELKKAVDHFLEGEWAAKSSEFVFCTTSSTVERKLANAVEMQAERLRDKEIAFTIWDVEGLSERLRGHPDLVERFFGPGWLKVFLPGAAAVNLDARIASIEQAVSRHEGLEILIFDWDPEECRRELKQLKDEDFELFRKLEERIGNPPHVDRVVNLISERPEWLGLASARGESSPSLLKWLGIGCPRVKLGLRRPGVLRATRGQVSS